VIPASDEERLLAAIASEPGLRWRAYAFKTGMPLRSAEDAIYNLWADKKIQMDADSTLRLPRAGEDCFRYDT
jgi:hypothetical protein